MRMLVQRSMFVVVSAGLAAIGFVATSGCSESSTPPPASVPLAELPTGYAAAICEAADTCFGQLLPIFLAGGDCETPYRGAIANGALPLFEAAIARGTLIYDGARASACFDAIGAGGCDTLSGTMPAVCEEALEGTVALGGVCDVDAECAGDTACVQNTTCPGTCTMRGGPGRMCARDEECQSGFVCDSTSCTAPPSEGQACQGPSAPDCRDGLICVGGNETRAGTCRTQMSLFTAAEGATCDLEAGPYCQEGLSCIVDGFVVGVGATLLCARPVATGAACKIGVPTQCPLGEYCTARLVPGMTEGTCMPLPVGGEPCAMDTFGPACAAVHVCVGATCRPLQANGGACESVAECYGGVCTAGVCAVPMLCAAP